MKGVRCEGGRIIHVPSVRGDVGRVVCGGTDRPLLSPDKSSIA